MRDHLHGAHDGRGFPVAFTCKAVTIGHEALDGEARELGKAMQILEGVAESRESTLLQE